MTIFLDLPQGFEDCEIRSISFDHPNVVIKLFDSSEIDYYTITFYEVDFFIFESDHIQNVIGRIYNFNNIDDAFMQVDFRNFCEQRNISGLIREKYGNRQVCYFYPITAGDAVVIYTKLAVEIGLTELK